MGGLIQLPHLAVPEQLPTDPLEKYGQLLSVQKLAAGQQLQQSQIQNAQLDTQAKQLEVAQAQRDAQDHEAVNKAFMDSGGDPQKFQQLLPQYGASFNASQKVQTGIVEHQKALAGLDEQTFKATKEANTILGQHLQSVLGAAPEDQAAQYTLELNAIKRNPQLAKYAANIPPQFPGADALKQTEISLGMNDALYKAAEEQRKQETQEAELPGKKAESQLKQLQLTAAQSGGVAPGIPLENQEATAWLAKNPGKTLADYQKYAKTLVPAFNLSVQNSTGGAGAGASPADIAKRFGMNQEAFDQAAEKYYTTGNLPPVGHGMSGIALNRALMNRAGDLHPGASLAENSAEFKANQASLSKLQTNFDQVTAFENTAGKNLDVFLNAAKPIVDSGSPWINKPLRAVAAGALGSADQAAFNAARQTAVTEIAKVLNSSNASGVLSDSARHEVEGLIKPDATMKQIYSAANILKQDMANRHQAYQEQISDIQGRMRGGTPPPNTQQQTQQGGAQHVPGGQAQGLKEGDTGTGSNGQKYIVKGGVWVPAKSQ